MSKEGNDIIETILLEGLLSLHSWGEESDILFLSSVNEPLAELLWDRIHEKIVSARYWIADKSCTKDDANEAFIRKLHGLSDCVLEARYSEITGYLWTDEEIKIGGHDLCHELRSNVGKWLILEIDVHGVKVELHQEIAK